MTDGRKKERELAKNAFSLSFLSSDLEPHLLSLEREPERRL